jgi:hemerythrin superfamily protein
MKKFHYIYLHSKIFEAPIEKLNEILEKVFLHKIDKYYYYQDQIKQFQLMKDDDDEQEKRFLELKKKKKIMNVAKLNSINF